MKEIDVSQFDTAETALLAHWRGFTKYVQPDGRVAAIGSVQASGNALGGLFANEKAADLAIANFYFERSTAP